MESRRGSGVRTQADLLDGQYSSKQQWTVVLLCVFAHMANQADRVVMSIALVPMSHELGLSPFEQGWIISSFAYGYLLTQIIAGPLAERHGPGRVLCAALLGWSITTISTPIAASNGLLVLYFVRVCMGFCEGFCMPSSYTWMSRVVSVSRRSRSFGMLLSGGSAGQLLAYLICPQLDWPQMFLLFGLLGLVWITAYHFCQAPSEKDAFHAPLCASTGVYLKLLKSRALWAVFVPQMMHSWGYMLLGSWLPTYLHRKLKVQNVGVVAVPLLLSSVLGPTWGAFADYLHQQRGVPLLRVRRLLTAVGTFGPAVIFAVFPYVASQFVALLLVCCIYVCYGCLGSGVFSNHADILPTHAGTAFGLGNTIATIPGLAIGPFTAYLIAKNDDWTPVFHIAALCSVIGGSFFCLFSEVEPIEKRLGLIPCDSPRRSSTVLL